jgi:hypothetical protein
MAKLERAERERQERERQERERGVLHEALAKLS